MSTRAHAQARRYAPRSRSAVPSPRTGDDGGWVTRAAPRGAVVTSSGTSLGEGSVEDTGDRVVVSFWTAPRLPAAVRARLVALTFRHAAVRPGRPVLVCVPAGDTEVLVRARAHLTLEHTHTAGVTCLVEGVVEGAGGRGPLPSQRTRGTAGTPVAGRRPLLTSGR